MKCGRVRGRCKLLEISIGRVMVKLLVDGCYVSFFFLNIYLEKQMSYSRTVGSASRDPRRSAGVSSSLRTNNRSRNTGYFSPSGNGGYSSYSNPYGSGNSLGHSYGSNSYGSYGSYHSPPSYSNYGSSYSTYGGTNSGYGSLHLPSGSSVSSYLTSPSSSSMKHLSPSLYSKPISRSPTRSVMGSRTGSTSSLLSLKSSEGSEGYGVRRKFFPNLLLIFFFLSFLIISFRVDNNTDVLFLNLLL